MNRRKISDSIEVWVSNGTLFYFLKSTYRNCYAISKSIISEAGGKVLRSSVNSPWSVDYDPDEPEDNEITISLTSYGEEISVDNLSGQISIAVKNTHRVEFWDTLVGNIYSRYM